jgi:glycosyltransferase involved in cell wall biosynthesis
VRALLDRKSIQLRNLGIADAVFAPSRFLAGMFTQNGFSHGWLEVVPYGLEPGRIVPIAAVRPRRPLRLGFCGVLSPWKSPHVVVEAVRRTSAAVALRVHGRTEEPMFRDYIDKVLAAALGDPRITFAGPYAEAQVAQVFADMDLLVVPSTWYENTPFVVLEAFAAGVPVIASDLGGLSEIVREGENGLLFEAGNAAALARTIERVADDPVLFSQLRPRRPPDITANYDRFERAYGR